MHQCPVESGRIIGNIEDDRMRVVCDLGGRNHVQDCAVIQDDRNKLKDIDGDRLIIRVITHVEQRVLLDLIWEIQMPPELEGYGVSSSSVQAGIAECCCHWRLRHD